MRYLLVCLFIVADCAAATGDIRIQQQSSAGSWPNVTFATANNGVWITTAGGVPAITPALPGLYGGTGVANTGKTITLGGNLTTSGAFATTFTVTGATSVTLPTSGTLATTAATVPSIAGTSGQVLVNGGTASVAGSAVTLSLPTDITGVYTITSGGGLQLSAISGGASLLLQPGVTDSIWGSDAVIHSLIMKTPSVTTIGETPNLWLTARGNGVGDLAQLGFGYYAGGHPPALIGFISTSVAGNTKGDVIIAARDSTADIAATEIARFRSGGNFSVIGSVTTAAPTAGTAGAWKLGAAITSSGLLVSTTVGVRVNIGGSDITLATLTTNP